MSNPFGYPLPLVKPLRPLGGAVGDGTGVDAVAVRNDDSEGSGDATAFDPRGVKVRVVLAHLKDHPEDTERVVELERAGQARRSILALLP